MSTFVLVSGAWHDGSAWEPVIQHLESKGHQAFSPTTIGQGKGVGKVVNHAQCVECIVDYIVSENLTDVVLLGHSFGGNVISNVVIWPARKISRCHKASGVGIRACQIAWGFSALCKCPAVMK